MGLATKLYAATTARQTSTNDLGTLEHTLPMTALFASMADGTDASEADLLFDDRRTLTASSTENLDLAGGLTDAFGGTLTFAKIKSILVKASADNTNSVIVGGAGSNTFTGPFGNANDVVSVPPGGCFLITAPVNGWTVTASTGDILKIANSAGGTSVTYDIVLVGTSA